jgi:hypothetical protein
VVEETEGEAVTKKKTPAATAPTKTTANRAAAPCENAVLAELRMLVLVNIMGVHIRMRRFLPDDEHVSIISSI